MDLHLTLRDLNSLLDDGDLSSSVYHRRQTLIAAAKLALQAKTHTPVSRARVRKFLEAVQAEDNNDEVEVTQEIITEIAMHAMDAKSR